MPHVLFFSSSLTHTHTDISYPACFSIFRYNSCNDYITVHVRITVILYRDVNHTCLYTCCLNHTYLNSLVTASTTHSLVGVGGDSGGASHLNAGHWWSQRLVLRSSRLQASSRVSTAEHAAAPAAADAQNNGDHDDDKQHYPTSNSNNEPAERLEYLVRPGWKRKPHNTQSCACTYTHTHTHTHTHMPHTHTHTHTCHTRTQAHTQHIIGHTAQC